MKNGDRVEVIAGVVKGVTGRIVRDDPSYSMIFVEVKFDEPFVFEGHTYTEFPFSEGELKLIES